MTCDFDVFVVGGGPAGLAAAIAVRNKGFSVAVADVFQFDTIQFVDREYNIRACFAPQFALGVRRKVLHRRMVERASELGVRFFWVTQVNGVSERGVTAGERTYGARWIIGADGSNSRVRRWAGLEGHSVRLRRFGFRQHYRLRPWSG